MTEAFKFDINSDDDDLTLEVIAALPRVTLPPLEELDLLDAHEGDDHYDYFKEALSKYDIYMSIDEAVYLVERAA